MAHIIVMGNEKGGTGKSTTCMHVATALARMGHRVGALDLDLRQRSFARYIENRRAFVAREARALPCPDYRDLPEVDAANLDPGENPYDHRLSVAVAALETEVDFIVIDCPGSHTRLSQVAHSLADTLVTPVNGSSMDLALLGRFNPVTRRLTEPGCFAELVRDLREERHRRGMKSIDWIVVKNRIRDSENRQLERIDPLLEQLAKALDFRLGHGFGERVTYRELFTFGLTHLDRSYFPNLTRTDIPTEQELTQLMTDLDLPEQVVAESRPDRRWRFKPFGRSSKAFGASLYAHMQPKPQKLAKTA